jgi:ABC-type multidrug transport system fused ATPase/permease subunit
MTTITSIRSYLPYLHKVAELINLERSLEAELLPLDTEPEPLSFRHEVTLNNISFRYSNVSAEAVNGLSMNIKAGKTVGLVGLSGAGKTTLVNLLTGLIPPQSGQILVDGVLINRDNSRSWLKRIGFVAQAPYILDASLAENVALSCWGEEIDRNRVLECCRMAALDFVDELEHGIDTILGDRGTRLSGGQAQRVAIARALYSEPDLIILDEATSSLDMKNEKIIHETILSLRNHVTMIIIAHRLTTVESCDSIIWMEKGQVHMVGSAEEVLPEYRATLRSRKTVKPVKELIA